MKYCCHVATPVGAVRIEEEDGAIVALCMERAYNPVNDRETPLLKEAAAQLARYLSGERFSFDLPLRLEGTPFQKRVWAALRQIPYGQTRTYAQIAQAVGTPKAFRAVGGANHCNPVMIFVPCHRVIGADGSLTGFGGGLPVKEFLLNLERKNAQKAASALDAVEV